MHVILRRAIPPWVSILTAVLSSCIMAHLLSVAKKEKMLDTCWKVGEYLLVRARVVLLDKGPPSKAKMLV